MVYNKVLTIKTLREGTVKCCYSLPLVTSMPQTATTGQNSHDIRSKECKENLIEIQKEDKWKIAFCTTTLKPASWQFQQPPYFSVYLKMS